MTICKDRGRAYGLTESGPMDSDPDLGLRLGWEEVINGLPRGRSQVPGECDGGGECRKGPRRVCHCPWGRKLDLGTGGLGDPRVTPTTGFPRSFHARPGDFRAPRGRLRVPGGAARAALDARAAEDARPGSTGLKGRPWTHFSSKVHTNRNIPDPISTRKTSRFRSDQYWGR